MAIKIVTDSTADLSQNLVQESQPFDMAAVVHSDILDEAEQLLDQLVLLYMGDVCVSHFGPVLGTYVGPGTMGFAIRQA